MLQAMKEKQVNHTSHQSKNKKMKESAPMNKYAVDFSVFRPSEINKPKSKDVIQGFFNTSLTVTRGLFHQLIGGMRKIGISEEVVRDFQTKYFSDEDCGDMDGWLTEHTGNTALGLVNIFHTDDSRITRLCVGEGTFGFSDAFISKHGGGDRGSGMKLIPTAYEPRRDPIFSEPDAKMRIRHLRRQNISPMFGIDATKLDENPFIMRAAPTQVQFNCPRIYGRVKGYSTNILIEEFLDSVCRMPSVQVVYITLPTSASYAGSVSQVKKCYGRHFSFEFVQEKTKPDPYGTYDFQHEITGTTQPREGLETAVYKLVKRHSEEQQELFAEEAPGEDSDFEEM